MYTFCTLHSRLYAEQHGCRECWLSQRPRPEFASIDALVEAAAKIVPAPEWARGTPVVSFARSCDDGWIVSLLVLWWTGETYEGGDGATYYEFAGYKLAKREPVPDARFLKLGEFVPSALYGLTDPPEGSLKGQADAKPVWRMPEGASRMDGFAQLVTDHAITS